MAGQLDELLANIQSAIAVEQTEISKAGTFLSVVNRDALPEIYEDIQLYKNWCNNRLGLLNDANLALLKLQEHHFPDRPMWRVKHQSLQEMNGVVSLIGSILPNIEEFPTAEIMVDAAEEVVNANT